MVRRLAVVIAVATSLVIARGAWALPITPVDFDSWTGGSIVLSHTAPFLNFFDPTITTGELSSDVLFDGLQYTYLRQVTPHNDPYNSPSGAAAFRGAPSDREGHTSHDGGNFTGIAGWSFSDALRAGGTGTATDFSIDFGAFTTTSPDPWWDAFEPIRFFYVMQPLECQGPMAAEHCSVGLRRRVYGLTGTPGGIADSLTPVPEPGSIMLLGSGSWVSMRICADVDVKKPTLFRASRRQSHAAVEVEKHAEKRFTQGVNWLWGRHTLPLHTRQRLEEATEQRHHQSRVRQGAESGAARYAAW